MIKKKKDKYKYLPNTPEEEYRFRWWLMNYNARAFAVVWYIYQKEKEWQDSSDE